MKSKLKNLLLLPLIAVPMMGLTSCDKAESEVNCTIEFLKNNDLNAERFSETIFNKGEKIYLLVAFGVKNAGDASDVLSMSIDFPYAQYYSTLDWERGPRQPHIDPNVKRTDPITGETISVLHISDMQFTIPNDGANYNFNYIFSLSGSQVCENMKAEVTFNDKDSQIVKSGVQKTWETTYSFIENTEIEVI